MLTLASAWPSWLIGILTVVFLLICALLILTIMIQRPQGGGLASAFGGAGGAGQTAFGAKTGDAVTIFTIAVFILYLGAAIALNYGTQARTAPPPEPVIAPTSPTPEPPQPSPQPTPQPTPQSAPDPAPQDQPDVLPAPEAPPADGPGSNPNGNP